MDFKQAVSDYVTAHEIENFSADSPSAQVDQPSAKDACKAWRQAQRQQRSHLRHEYAGILPLARATGLAGSTIARREVAIFQQMMEIRLPKWAYQSCFQRPGVYVPLDDKRVSAHNCRRYMATTQLAMGRSPFDVLRQMVHTTLTMTNHYASLRTDDLKRSQERYPPLRAKDLNNKDTFGSGYWEE